MNRLLHLLLFAALLNLMTSCSGQTNRTSQSQKNYNAATPVGGGCDGCEIMFEGIPSTINATDTSAGWNENGQRLLVSGKVFALDGKTPAPNVIVYYWHTDNNGYYSPTTGMNENAKRHGHIRGWVKTNANGDYAIYTIRPAPYPNEDMPAHIHIAIKEPNVANEYYIDDLVFDDDKLLTDSKRKALEHRGGSGILKVSTRGAMQIAEHNIVLGFNIPNYPSGQ